MKKAVLFVVLFLVFGIAIGFVNAECDESDSGWDLYEKGSCSGDGSPGEDNCVEEGVYEDWLKEYICHHSGNCQFGYYECVCENGKCVEEIEKPVYEEPGTYTVKQRHKFKMNNVEVTVLEIGWALSGDIEPYVTLQGQSANVCTLHEGEDCKFFYGPVMDPYSYNLKIRVNSIETNDESPLDSTASLTIEEINEKIKEDEEEEPEAPSHLIPDEDPAEIPEDGIEEDGEDETEEEEAVVFCSGCSLDEKCYPLGYRKGGEYCSEDGVFVDQSKGKKSCDNNFECESDVCVDGKCVSSGLIRKILGWLSRLFGLE